MAPGTDILLPPTSCCSPSASGPRTPRSAIRIISKRIAVTLVAAFLLLLGLAPALQLGSRGPTEIESGLLPRAGPAATGEQSPPGMTALQALMAGNRALLATVERIERDLDDRSVVGRAIPPVGTVRFDATRRR